MLFPEKKCQFAPTASTNSLQSLVLQGFELVEANSGSHCDPTLQIASFVLFILDQRVFYRHMIIRKQQLKV